MATETQPRSLRLTESILRRLNRMAARRTGMKPSALAVQLIEEGLRMEEHPGVVFREGPAGRRAVTIGGPDVWEVIRAVQSQQARTPGVAENPLIDQIAENTGVPQRLVHIAIDYWAAYPQEVNEWVDKANEAEIEYEVEWQRRKELLTG